MTEMYTNSYLISIITRFIPTLTRQTTAPPQIIDQSSLPINELGQVIFPESNLSSENTKILCNGLELVYDNNFDGYEIKTNEGSAILKTISQHYDSLIINYIISESIFDLYYEFDATSQTFICKKAHYINDVYNSNVADADHLCFKYFGARRILQ
jgi:hypothetical protein